MPLMARNGNDRDGRMRQLQLLACFDFFFLYWTNWFLRAGFTKVSTEVLIVRYNRFKWPFIL